MLYLNLPYTNLILQLSLCVSLTFVLNLIRIPVLLLQSLHSYIHPDHVPQNSSGLKAAIRRPSDPPPNPEPRKRNKSKSKFEFDESNAQIFRIKLDEPHLHSRIFFKDYYHGFNFTLVTGSCLLLNKFLNFSKDSGIWENGSFVPVFLGFFAIWKVLASLAKVSFEMSASRRSEKRLAGFCGILGFLFGILLCFEIVPSLFAFEFGSVDGFGRLFIAVMMGSIVAFLYMPTGKNARAFWLGTDQICCNLSIISLGWFSRMLLYANCLLSIFVALLWINPFVKILVNESEMNPVRGSGRLVGNIGMSQSELASLRFWCLLLWGILHMVALRWNVQMFLNEAVLSWYQRLHGSRVPDLDFSRAKIFLHNHYLCLAALQFFAPPAMVLLFISLSQVEGFSFRNFYMICNVMPCSAFIKDVATFFSWWVVLVWAVFTSANLVLYRRGNLHVS